MGSSSAHIAWLIAAVLSGILFLIFDAARNFAQRLSPVALRRWSAYDPQNFQLMSGALLQITLLVAVVTTALAFDALIAVVAWVLIAVAWKFVLALVPEEVGEVVVHGLIPLSRFFYLLFFPFVQPLRRFREQHEADEEDEEVTDEEVQAYIDVGEEEGILEGTEGKLLQSIVDFGDLLAKEIMTPRIDVQAFDVRRPLAELAGLFNESKYSRIPVYEESIDRITGIVHIKDVFDAVLQGELQKPVAEIARPPYFVSETKKVSELLREFQIEHVQVAVVVDEYGGTAGIISIEDIVEEIVGDISDEHEDEEATLVDLGGGEYLVKGQMRIDQLEEMLDANLEGEDYETVAGLIFTTLGRVPQIGAVVTKNGFRFEVERADRRRIDRVKITREPELREEAV
jgi:CBS domain containing-hemolysin-like protein